MRQHVEIGYGADGKKSAVEVRISPDGTGLVIRANRHGMALLASMVADFLLHPDPASFHYAVDRSHGMRAGCPKIKIQILVEHESNLLSGSSGVIEE